MRTWCKGSYYRHDTMRTGQTRSSERIIGDGYATTNRTGSWWRRNRSIRWYGLLALAGTKFADVVTTAVGVRYIPTIVEANPIAHWTFAGTGLFSGLTLLGVFAIVLAACGAELSGVEIRRRFGLPKTALVAQASVYLIVSAIFGLVALHNSALIAEQATHMIDDVFAMPSALE